MKNTIIEIITLLYIILFLYTGISKIIDYPIFKEQIAASEILSPISKPLAITIPLIEFALVVLLVIPKWRLKGLYASTILMTMFTIYVVSILSFSKELPCSCGGVISELSWGQHIVFNCAFITMGMVAIALEKKVEKLNHQQLASIVQA